jgi:phosphoribosylanthranilate isomerase
LPSLGIEVPPGFGDKTFKGLFFSDSIAGAMIIQIYEIQEPREAALMAECGVDHVGGVILSSDEWKIPALKESVRVVREAGRKSSIIPLFAEPDAVHRVLDHYAPDIIHFCDSLSHGASVDEAAVTAAIALQEGVKRRFPEVEVMRSIPIAPPALAHCVPSLELGRRLEAVSDWFLTDTLLVEGQEQPVPGHVGITGKVCDWEVARDLVEQSGIPVILAGGLSPENVGEGVRLTLAAGADTCTATNLLDEHGMPIRFRKNPEKVRRFVEACRQAAKR